MAPAASRSTRLAITSWPMLGDFHFGRAAALGAAGREALRGAAFFAGFFAWTFFFAGLFFFAAFLAICSPVVAAHSCTAWADGQGGGKSWSAAGRASWQPLENTANCGGAL